MFSIFSKGHFFFLFFFRFDPYFFIFDFVLNLFEGYITAISASRQVNVNLLQNENVSRKYDHTFIFEDYWTKSKLNGILKERNIPNGEPNGTVFRFVSLFFLFFCLFHLLLSFFFFNQRTKSKLNRILKELNIPNGEPNGTLFRFPFLSFSISLFVFSVSFLLLFSCFLFVSGCLFFFFLLISQS